MSTRIKAPLSSWYALAILAIVGVFNYLDRMLLAVLQIPIKAELGLSDTQLGAMIGLSFALIYTTMGLPLARLADRTNRVVVLGLALAVWTILTAFSGFATSFVTLLVCRMGVALGEAACAPICHSLISDYFPRQQRGTAVSIWALSIPLGIILGFLLAGWMGSELGWRNAFFYVGLAGLVLVPVVLFTLRDPPRGLFESGVSGKTQPPLRDVAAIMWKNQSYRLVLVATSLHLFTVHSVQAWLPQYYARAFAMPVQDVGETVAISLGVGGAIGTFLGGYAADRLTRIDERWYAWLPAAAGALFVPLSIAQYWVPTLSWSIGLGVAGGALMQVYFAPMIAVTQTLMPPAIRTFTGAFYVFFVNVVAMGIGPLTVGLISDNLATAGASSAEALRVALTFVQVGTLASIPVYLLTGSRLRRDLAVDH